MNEMKGIRQRYSEQDRHFLFEANAEKVQMAVYNQGDEPIGDASLAIVIPNHSAFYVADRLPKLPRKDKFADRSPEERSMYPAVSLRDDSVHISAKIGDVPIGEPVEVFSAPLRICTGHDLKGRKFSARNSLFGQNLRSPAKGVLRLIFG